jgi:hypothetical protein
LLALKSMRFVFLKDRDLCYALPDAQYLDGISPATLRNINMSRIMALKDGENRKNSQLPNLMVPKLTHNNYNEFETQFSQVISR